MVDACGWLLEQPSEQPSTNHPSNHRWLLICSNHPNQGMIAENSDCYRYQPSCSKDGPTYGGRQDVQKSIKRALGHSHFSELKSITGTRRVTPKRKSRVATPPSEMSLTYRLHITISSQDLHLLKESTLIPRTITERLLSIYSHFPLKWLFISVSLLEFRCGFIIWVSYHFSEFRVWKPEELKTAPNGVECVLKFEAKKMGRCVNFLPYKTACFCLFLSVHVV